MVPEILPRGTVVKVIGLNPEFNHAVAPQPPIGLIGRVSTEDHHWYDFARIKGKMLPIEFKAVDLGFIWEEGDDPDEEYVCLYMPLDLLELS